MTISDTTSIRRPRVAETADDIIDAAHALLGGIGAGAAARERNRQLPYEQIRQLADAGVGALRVPADHDGPGATIVRTIEFVIALSAADSNVAQAIRPHFGMVEGIISGTSHHEASRWYPHILSGDLFGIAHGEVGSAHADIRTRYTVDGNGFRVTGEKYYSTGCLFADWLRISAKGDDGETRWFVVPRDREGVEVIDDWDGSGQRLTASGSTRLTDVWVDSDEIVERNAPTGERSHVLTFQQLYLAAIEAGIAKNALADAEWFTVHRARPIVHSTADSATSDPYVRHAVGEIAARAYAAESSVLRAAGTLDAATGPGATGEHKVEAVVDVAKAQYVAIESALKAAELLFDVGGGSITARDLNYDRHWRNARTVANHNPRAHKAGVIGDHVLTGAEPPVSGLF
ncbi:acyl-CoA dehydrogenase family protein [Gordonia soli]|uniref:Dibenzothiophene monooxygenase n=1 Tax=Gordonia soli NBRC 108243 TaxID=1223545 RepID=M0QEP8_9ACTN|nr:acyl-CoA dehydrogenase family protein [Gordonia soli]GAC66904.1 hypothetical protein GS4_05_01130 [Gordonia soli NBRC 108243]